LLFHLPKPFKSFVLKSSGWRAKREGIPDRKLFPEKRPFGSLFPIKFIKNWGVTFLPLFFLNTGVWEENKFLVLHIFCQSFNALYGQNNLCFSFPSFTSTGIAPLVLDDFIVRVTKDLSHWTLFHNRLVYLSKTSFFFAKDLS